jgi:hypothetical protein
MKKAYSIAIIVASLVAISLPAQAQNKIRYRVDKENNSGLKFGMGFAMSAGLYSAGGNFNGFYNINQRLTFHTSNMYSIWATQYDTRQGLTLRIKRRAVVEENARLDVDSKTQNGTRTTTYIKTDFKVLEYVGLRAGANLRKYKESDKLDNEFFNNDFKMHAGFEFGEQYNQSASFSGKRTKVRGLNYWYTDMLFGKTQTYITGETGKQKRNTTPFGWRLGYERYAGALNIGFSYTSHAYFRFAALEGHIGLVLSR